MEHAVWAQTIILGLTALVVLWYTLETSRMRKQIARQTSLSLRPVVVFEFQQDTAPNRLLLAKNVGPGAAFNIATLPLNIVPGSDGWDIHFERIYSLGSQEQKRISYKMPVVVNAADKGYLFFPGTSSKRRDLRIEYQDVEGRRYRQDLAVHPQNESQSEDGYVIYSPIQELGFQKSRCWADASSSKV